MTKRTILLALAMLLFATSPVKADELYLKSVLVTLVRGGNVVYNDRDYYLHAVANMSDGTSRVVTSSTEFRTSTPLYTIEGGSVLSIPTLPPAFPTEFYVYGRYTFNGVTKQGRLKLAVAYKPIITDITIYGPVTVIAGQTAYYTARAYYDDGTNKLITAMNGVSWITDDSGIGYFIQPGTLRTMSNLWGQNPLTLTIHVNDDGRWSHQDYEIVVIRL